MKADFTRYVEAPAALVWHVVTDLDAYPRWNPFVVRCQSTLEPGTPITMRVHLYDRWALTQREEIFEHVPGERLCYGLRSSFLGALSSERCHLLRAESATRTRYESRFALSGRLAPVVAGLLGRRLERGFERMTSALVRRAEELAAIR